MYLNSNRFILFHNSKHPRKLFRSFKSKQTPRIISFTVSNHELHEFYWTNLNQESKVWVCNMYSTLLTGRFSPNNATMVDKNIMDVIQLQSTSCWWYIFLSCLDKTAYLFQFLDESFKIRVRCRVDFFVRQRLSIFYINNSFSSAHWNNLQVEVIVTRTSIGIII